MKSITKANRAPGPAIRILALLALLTAASVPAQVTWNTTSTNTPDVGSASLISSGLRVKVFPAYLDVEEDVEISVTGTVRAPNDSKKLQIVGTFTLPAGAAVTGALLWDSSHVYQAKLLDKAKADSIYKDLVAHDSTPTPRPIDPLILEYVGSTTTTSTYRISVYPVGLNQSRHFRLRYQLPPKMGVDGFEMRLQAALIPLFAPSGSSVTTNFEGGAGVSRIRFVEGGLTREMQLPRAVFLSRANLSASTVASATALRVLPLNPLRQAMLKTSFGTGTFAGEYLNLYAAPADSLLAITVPRIEIVFYWKWQNLPEWKFNSKYGTDAKTQAASLLALYNLLGLPGSRVGLLHDDTRKVRAYKAAIRSDSSYSLALDYLKSVQGSYVDDFVNNVQYTGPGGSGSTSPALSKNQFLSNMQIVRTLYSPDEGIVRHLVLVSAGPDYVTNTTDMNAAFDSILGAWPLSVSYLKNQSFSQAGFDMVTARQAHLVKGTVTSTAQADLPGFPSITLLATVKNSQKAYDFSVPCTGGLGLSCSTLEFHGKSVNPWNDTVSWEAYQPGGQLLGRTKVSTGIYSRAQDTGAVLVWAGSATPFAEVKEKYFGPVYGFVDVNASLLTLPRDSINGSAYADSGVPYAGGIPDYLGPATPSIPATSIQGSLGDPSRWGIEYAGNGLMRVRIPGLVAGTVVELIVTDLNGKQVLRKTVVSEAGLLRWTTSGLRPGAYLMRLRASRFSGEKLLMLP